ncbi:MAG: hypothetical protein UHY90_07765 [Treponema sp.]|nr:hypothetical protein [Treponema sp.]
MKKSIIFIAAAVSAVLLLDSCGSTPSTADAVPKSANVAAANNTGVSAQRIEFLQWQEQEFGDPAQPAWLRTLAYGNPNQYITANIGEGDKANELRARKWIVPSMGTSLNRETALNNARLQAMQAIGTEMSVSINGSLGNSVSDQGKSTIAKFCAETSAKLTGLREDGTYWYYVKITDATGNSEYQYRGYVFYTLDPKDYQEQVAYYMLNLLNDPRLPEDVRKALMDKKLGIIQDAVKAEKTDAQQKEIDRQVREAKHELEMEQQKTEQVKAESKASAAEAVAAKAPYITTSAVQALMDFGL